MNKRIKTSIYLLLLPTALIVLLVSCRQPETPLLTESIAESATPALQAPKETNMPTAVPPTAVLPATITATLAAAITVPVPWPAQDAQLLCQESGQTRLWRYRPDEQTWQDENFNALRSPNFTPLTLTAVNGDAGVLVHGLYQEDDAVRFQAYLWQAGRAQLVLDETQAYLPAPALSRFSHPPGRYLFATRETEAGSQLLRLDLEQCRAGDCQLALVDNLAVWSPAGTQTLVQSWSDQEQLLWRGDASGQAATPIGPGFAPFWLDEQRYGYLRPLTSATNNQLPESELVIATIDAPAAEAEVLLSPAQLHGFLQAEPAWRGPAATTLANAATTPNQAGRIFLTALAPEAEMISPLYLFTLDSQTGELNWIPEGETTAWLGLEFSGDGRYLAVPGGTDLLLLDLVDGQTRSYASAFQPGSVTYDWSTDEAWVLLSGGNQLILAAPNHDYEQVIPLAGQSCLSGVWVSR